MYSWNWIWTHHSARSQPVRSVYQEIPEGRDKATTGAKAQADTALITPYGLMILWITPYGLMILWITPYGLMILWIIPYGLMILWIIPYGLMIHWITPYGLDPFNRN
jgi:hypothetical protein